MMSNNDPHDQEPAGQPARPAANDDRRDTPGGDDVGPGGYDPTSGASDLGGGETGLGDDFDDEDAADSFLEDKGNPQSGFAEQGAGAPNDGGNDKGGV